MGFFNKCLILATSVLILAVAAAPLALAAGYNIPQQYISPPKGPHGGYVTTSNKCKECHAVHLATGTYMLTRADSRSAACDFCHGIGGLGTGTKISLNAEGHGLSPGQESSPTITAPDDISPPYSIQPSRWGCPECHSVHDSQTVRLTRETGVLVLYDTTKLLKANPNPSRTSSSPYLYYDPALINETTRETTQTISHWCSTCHNANFGLHTDRKLVDGVSVYSHDSSGGGYSTDTAGRVEVKPLDGINKGPTCKQCHKATGIGGKFPHSSESTSTTGQPLTTPDMLEAGTKANELDRVCTGCHYTPSLP
ncbi:MAG: hypothetical protein IBX64_08030 [Actinobacteria bacterium]|nr:hypothetical protein [Actinomycetota bacterium]